MRAGNATAGSARTSLRNISFCGHPLPVQKRKRISQFRNSSSPYAKSGIALLVDRIQHLVSRRLGATGRNPPNQPNSNVGEFVH
jgi:hypothetical protein